MGCWTAEVVNGGTGEYGIWTGFWFDIGYGEL